MVLEWSNSQLEEMGLYSPFDKALFLSGCTRNSICGQDIQGFIVTLQDLENFATIFIELKGKEEND